MSESTRVRSVDAAAAAAATSQRSAESIRMMNVAVGGFTGALASCRFVWVHYKKVPQNSTRATTG